MIIQNPQGGKIKKKLFFMKEQVINAESGRRNGNLNFPVDLAIFFRIKEIRHRPGIIPIKDILFFPCRFWDAGTFMDEWRRQTSGGTA